MKTVQDILKEFEERFGKIGGSVDHLKNRTEAVQTRASSRAAFHLAVAVEKIMQEEEIDLEEKGEMDLKTSSVCGIHEGLGIYLGMVEAAILERTGSVGGEEERAILRAALRERVTELLDKGVEMTLHSRNIEEEMKKNAAIPASQRS